MPRPPRLLALALLAALAACADAPAAPGNPAPTFTLEVNGETFRLRADDAAVVAALRARARTGQRGVIMGTLAAGDGGFNAPHAWHLLPASVALPDVTIELCDGRPSDLARDLPYWLGTVGRYCPWSARVAGVAP